MATTSRHPLTDLTVPKTQKAAVFEEWGKPVSFVERPVVQESELKPGQVLVKIMYSGVCHTDLHTARADWPIMPPAPLVGGHEGTGFIVAIGPGTQSPVKIGQAVGVKWIGSSCLSCEACTRVRTGLMVDGTFQQYAVSYAAHVTPIPESVPLHLAAPILCAGVTVYKVAIKRADASPGDIVVIPGAGGGLGHLAIQYAINGFGLRVIAIDTGDNKKELCLKLGAETFIDFKKSNNLVEDVRRAADEIGVHAAIVTSGSAEGYNHALQYLRPGGTLVAVGAGLGAKLELDIVAAILRSITIRISYVGNREDARQALDMVARGRVQTTCRVEPLAKLPEVFNEMEEGKLAGRVVLDMAVFRYFGVVVGNSTPEGRDELLRYHSGAITLALGLHARSRIEEITVVNNVFLVVGITEKEDYAATGTLYCTATFVDPKQGLVGKHRKLMPTTMERLILWGFGGWVDPSSFGP
ncbi:alcohol dehydrogenase [Ceratobasidium sp. 423]|nr:alcohol dehydrogenase [Ceratobasidium sp. 423]